MLMISFSEENLDNADDDDERDNDYDNDDNENVDDDTVLKRKFWQC